MIKTRGLFGIAQGVPDSLRVLYKGIEYYPVAYELSFDQNGDTIHIAIIHDLKANAVVHAPLERVKPKIDNGAK